MNPRFPDLSSPPFFQRRICFIRDGGLWTVMEPTSGKRLVDRERVGTGGQYLASPVAANGLVYLVNESGVFTGLRAGDRLDVVSVNPLNERVRCTPALAGDCLVVRSESQFWAFSEPIR